MSKSDNNIDIDSDSDSDSEDDTYEYVYLIQPKYLLGTGIFKYGKTCSVHTRFGDYPTGSALYYISRVINCAYVEDCIGKAFSKHFIKHKNGKEYYSGNALEMIEKMETEIDKLKQKYIGEKDEKEENYKKMIKKYYCKKIINRLDCRKKNKYDKMIARDIAKNTSEPIDTNTTPKPVIVENNIMTQSNFLCKNCGAGFTQKIGLKYHLNHEACKEKNFSCNTCGKLFTSKTSMYRHIRSSCKNHQTVVKNKIFSKMAVLESQTKNLKRVIKNLK